MNLSEALEKLLPSYTNYYDIKKDNVVVPFAAEAEFHAHNEQYVLVKAAKIADIDSNEYVFFATEESLSIEKFCELDAKAWNHGLSRVNPKEGHRNSDVTLVILTNNLEEGVAKLIKKAHHSKTYKFGIRGWSNYSVICCDFNSGKLYFNRLGANYKKLLGVLLK